MAKNQNTAEKKWRENEKKRKAEQKRHDRRKRKENAEDAARLKPVDAATDELEAPSY